jgi:beta-glucanase (GH16 family)
MYTLTRGSSASAWSGSVTLIDLTKSTVVTSFTIPPFTTSSTFYSATAVYADISSGAIQTTNTASLQIQHFGTCTHKIGGNFTAPMTTYNSSLFYLSDYDPGAAALYYLLPANDVFNSSGLNLTLDNTPYGGKTYTSGEVQTNVYYGYGKAQVSMQMANTSTGTDDSFFMYTGSSASDPWDEIDFEYVPYVSHINQIHIGYFTNGVNYVGKYVNLGFDPRAAVHTYAIDYEPTGITWYVDGNVIDTETGASGPLPSHPMKMITNLWPGDANTVDFTGTFTYPGTPLISTVSNESYTTGFAP